jgi:hypothetical protein
MDDELLEKIDSLWFFSSVLRPSSHLITQNSEISKRRPEFTDAEKQNQEEQEQTMAKDPSQMDRKVKGGHCCKEIAGLEKRREKRKEMKSKNRVQNCIQQSSPEMKLEERTPFSVLYDSQMRNRGRRNEQVGIESQFRHLTMPLTSDDLAMKAKLRSWAYAVACSVR